MSSLLPKDHPAALPKKVGVLLLNLGTPDATDYWSMRRYLKEFLSDQRVIEIPKWKWWPILNGIILTVRPKRSGAAYDKIWDYENGDSPLRVISERQVSALRSAMSEHDQVLVDYAMRYGNPSTQSKLEALQAQGCDKILLVPLYPQYSAATTATANDKAFDTLKKMRWQPAVRTAPAYFETDAYVGAIAQSIEDGLANLDFEPDLVITSYHGVPKSYLLKGDPYHCQCIKSSRLVREKLGWPEDKLMVTFQSRFGPEEWLQPYTDKTLAALPGKGIKKVAILTPGFSVDCLETLEEIGMEGRELFLEAGGVQFAYIPCLNDSDLGMKVIEDVVRRELSGWI
ncbi:ferrochelatase [Maritalea sp.]|jgi:ferrochelatase|uniref:ferrochelatase n=1 Tax=Maritalea sp. TaxID=2003361 RepID=UPI0039E6290E